jgi:hypothetical protein
VRYWTLQRHPRDFEAAHREGRRNTAWGLGHRRPWRGSKFVGKYGSPQIDLRTEIAIVTSCISPKARGWAMMNPQQKIRND